MAYPDATHLPFNSTLIQDVFRPGPPDHDNPHIPGFWLVMQNDHLVLAEGQSGFSLPFGAAPAPGPWLLPPVSIGTWEGRPLRVGRLAPEVAIPQPYCPVPTDYRTSRLDDRLLTLSGLARQILHWRDRSQICPSCGGLPRTIPGSWGVCCPQCSREYYPRIHPAVIVLITRGDEFLLVRKPEWPVGFYGLVAGFVEFGESLEECAVREIKEETGLAVTDLRYLCSQSWPFPSQLMAGFSARYVGGDIQVDNDELEEAAWFRADRLPPALPSRISIARHILENYAPGFGKTLVR